MNVVQKIYSSCVVSRVKNQGWGGGLVVKVSQVFGNPAVRGKWVVAEAAGPAE